MHNWTRNFLFMRFDILQHELCSVIQVFQKVPKYMQMSPFAYLGTFCKMWIYQSNLICKKWKISETNFWSNGGCSSNILEMANKRVEVFIFEFSEKIKFSFPLYLPLSLCIKVRVFCHFLERWFCQILNLQQKIYNLSATASLQLKYTVLRSKCRMKNFDISQTNSQSNVWFVSSDR